ncbi:MAG TPA: LysE family translocator [Methylophilaceae bacterium]|jgi:threonine/homoserine/homoserine lactone efflux protein
MLPKLDAVNSEWHDIMYLPLDTLPGLMVYTFVMTITPGPNNLLLLSSGLNFGLRRTIRHMTGILSGVLLQILITGAGLGALFILMPELQTLLKTAGSIYMLWLARKLWHAGTLHGIPAAHSIGFLEALGFQFINPKSWIMATTVVAVFVPAGDSYGTRVAIAGGVFTGVALPCITVWAASGAWLRTCIDDAETLRLINWSLALLSVITALLLWV